MVYKKLSTKVLFQLIPYIWSSDRRIQARIYISLVLTFVMIGLNLCVPLIFKAIVNALSSSLTVTYRSVSLFLIAYGLSWMISQLITHIRTLLIVRILERGMHLLSLSLLDHLLSLSMRFHTERRTGALTSHIDRAGQGFENIFWGLIGFLIPACLELILVMGIVTFFYGWIYGAVLLCIMIGYLSFSFIFMNKALKAQEAHNEKHARASARMVDSLLNIDTVKYFNNEYHEHLLADQLLTHQEDAGVYRYTLEIYVQMGQVLVIGIGLTTLIWLSGKATYDQVITVGDFTLINGYILQFIIPLNYFGYFLHQVRKGIQNMHSLMEILHLKSEIQDIPQAIHISPTCAEIIFDNVSFGYTSDRPILKNVSFSVPVGKTVAIVGPSGTGKSTITRLLFRFYDVNEGAILINGHDIRSITQRSLRKALGVVPQDTILFNDTIYYNIAYGNPHASLEEVQRATQLAYLDHFIRTLPQGYNTIVGERGIKLSGGEKQRIAIARLLLKKPALYIFDEATSSLDTQTEREIQKNLEELSLGTTTLVIAHRLSTIVHADEIIVLNKGSIIERGTHTQLLQQDALYTELWIKQQHQEFDQTSGKV